MTRRLDRLQSAIAVVLRGSWTNYPLVVSKSVEAAASSSSTNEGLSAAVGRMTDDEWCDKWGVKGQAPPFRFPRAPLFGMRPPHGPICGAVGTAVRRENSTRQPFFSSFLSSQVKSSHCIPMSV